MRDEQVVKRIFFRALESVDPSSLVKGFASKIKSYYSIKEFSSLIVTGFGKAAYQMAIAVEEVFGPEIISGGVIVTKYGHAQKRQSAVSSLKSDELAKIIVCEAGHPVPDGNGIEATEKIIRLLKSADEKTLVLCLVSGGGSSLLVSPYDGMTLADKQSITDQLLKAGADITELNAVRKHLSKIKGGRLAEIVHPSEIISLMISDVIGDKLDVIASGPTAPDTSTFQDALNVIRKYKLTGDAPANVMEILNKGKEGLIPDTPKKDSPVFNHVQNIVVGSNIKALEAANSEAGCMGFETEIVSSEIIGEAKDAGVRMAEQAKEARACKNGSPRCYISGGETTVTVKGQGKGGRNTELALSFAMEIEGVEGITLLSAGTDGNDGPTDATGAVVDGDTIKKAKEMGLDPVEYLNNNDSYNFFRKIDSLLITGPTGTNVMDLQIVIVR